MPSAYLCLNTCLSVPRQLTIHLPRPVSPLVSSMLLTTHTLHHQRFDSLLKHLLRHGSIPASPFCTTAFLFTAHASILSSFNCPNLRHRFLLRYRWLLPSFSVHVVYFSLLSTYKLYVTFFTSGTLLRCALKLTSIQHPGQNLPTPAFTNCGSLQSCPPVFFSCFFYVLLLQPLATPALCKFIYTVLSSILAHTLLAFPCKLSYTSPPPSCYTSVTCMPLHLSPYLPCHLLHYTCRLAASCFITCFSSHLFLSSSLSPSLPSSRFHILSLLFPLIIST